LTAFIALSAVSNSPGTSLQAQNKIGTFQLLPSLCLACWPYFFVVSYYQYWAYVYQIWVHDYQYWEWDSKKMDLCSSPLRASSKGFQQKAAKLLQAEQVLLRTSFLVFLRQLAALLLFSLAISPHFQHFFSFIC